MLCENRFIGRAVKRRKSTETDGNGRVVAVLQFCQPGDCVAVAQCFDGEDNDVDGFVDVEQDPQCADVSDNDESS